MLSGLVKERIYNFSKEDDILWNRAGIFFNCLGRKVVPSSTFIISLLRDTSLVSFTFALKVRGNVLCGSRFGLL